MQSHYAGDKQVDVHDLNELKEQIEIFFSDLEDDKKSTEDTIDELQVDISDMSSVFSRIWQQVRATSHQEAFENILRMLLLIANDPKLG